MKLTPFTELVPVVVGLVFICGCAGLRPPAQTAVPDTEESLERALFVVDQSIRQRLEVQDYQGAIRLLPKEAALWDQLMKKTGKYYEGAYRFLHGLVMARAAAFGDSQWGAILDDSEIPHRYKTELIFEILEARLGKGSVYLGNSENIIVPRKRRVDLDSEMIRLPERKSSEPTATAGGEEAAAEPQCSTQKGSHDGWGSGTEGNEGNEGDLEDGRSHGRSPKGLLASRIGMN